MRSRLTIWLKEGPSSMASISSMARASVFLSRPPVYTASLLGALPSRILRLQRRSGFRLNYRASGKVGTGNIQTKENARESDQLHCQTRHPRAGSSLPRSRTGNNPRRSSEINGGTSSEYGESRLHLTWTREKFGRSGPKISQTWSKISRSRPKRRSLAQFIHFPAPDTEPSPSVNHISKPLN